MSWCTYTKGNSLWYHDSPTGNIFITRAGYAVLLHPTSDPHTSIHVSLSAHPTVSAVNKVRGSYYYPVPGGEVIKGWAKIWMQALLEGLIFEYHIRVIEGNMQGVSVFTALVWPWGDTYVAKNRYEMTSNNSGNLRSWTGPKWKKIVNPPYIFLFFTDPLHIFLGPNSPHILILLRIHPTYLIFLRTPDYTLPPQYLK